MKKLDMQAEEYVATGNIASEGMRNQLGRPRLDRLSLLVRESAQNAWDAKAARALLMASGDAEVRAVADARGWRMDAAGKAFVFREEEKPPSAKDIPAMQLIEQTMMYAKELERIV